VKADSAIVAIGYNPETTLYNQVKDETADTHLIGDAQQVQNIMYAIWGAYEVARNI
jgi:2-enoate reductase